MLSADDAGVSFKVGFKQVVLDVEWRIFGYKEQGMLSYKNMT